MPLLGARTEAGDAHAHRRALPAALRHGELCGGRRQEDHAASCTER